MENTEIYLAGFGNGPFREETSGFSLGTLDFGRR